MIFTLISNDSDKRVMKRSIVRWYIAKIKPRTENKIKEYLDHVGEKYFSPIQPDGQSLLPDLVFVHADKETVLQISKDSNWEMDFLYNPVTHQLQTVPDKQMTDFMFVHNHTGQLMVLPEPEKLVGGEKVRIVAGEYAGVEGEIYRIKGHKRVVVKLGKDLAVAAGNYIAKENLEKIES
jgi:transcription antitermination factor NusG